jgi:hypothetical protein
MTTPETPARRITLRALLLSLFFIGVMCWWIAYSEVRTGTTEITCTALPIGVVFVLFVLCSLNSLFARRWPQRALTGPELATIYILVAVGSSVAGIGMIGFLTPALSNPLWYTNNEKWKEFAEAVPWSWSPRDPEALRAFYLGNSTLYTWEHIRAWLPPLLTWCGFLLLLLFMTLCVLVLLRKQWIEHERLNFPITYVPLAMTVQPGGFNGLMRNRALLFGFAIPVVLQTINNLNWLFPSIPYIPVKPGQNGPLDIGARITAPPWNALGYFPLAFHPNTIGLSYLLATDVSFSCWFFYLVRKGLDVYCVAAGYRSGGGNSQSMRLPYTQEQGVGAWLCLAALTLWMARGHLLSAWRAAWHPRPAEQAQEGMSYRMAFLGAFGSFAGLVGFTMWGGLPLVPSLLLFGVTLAFILALTRIRAEVGTAWHFGPWITPPGVVARTLGPMQFDTTGLGVLAYQFWYTFDMRSLTTPHFIEGYRIAEQGKIANRKLTAAMLLAVVVGMVCACWTVLHLYYTYGASTAHVNPWRININKIGYQVMAAHAGEKNVGPDTEGMLGMGVGAAMTLLLNAARTRFTGWVFHPAGYAVANTFIIDLLWFPFFLGWLAKWLTLRYGGMRAYRAALPFFIGLILGDYVIASLWTLVGIALGIDMYRCFPN